MSIRRSSVPSGCSISRVKESTGDLTRITAIRRLTRDKITIVAGWESSSRQAFMAGATGWAPVCTNFAPDLAMRFFHTAVRERDAIDAGLKWDAVFPICEFICHKSHVRVAHTGLDILGRSVGPPRHPLRMLGADDRAKLKEILEEVGAKTG